MTVNGLKTGGLARQILLGRGRSEAAVSTPPICFSGYRLVADLENGQTALVLIAPTLFHLRAQAEEALREQLPEFTVAVRAEKWQGCAQRGWWEMLHAPDGGEFRWLKLPKRRRRHRPLIVR